MSQVFDSKGANDRSMILDLLKRSTNGSIVLDLSKVPDQWVVDLLNGIGDFNQPTVADSTQPKVNELKRNRHRPHPVKRARKRLRVARRTLQKTVLENRSKLLN